MVTREIPIGRREPYVTKMEGRYGVDPLPNPVNLAGSFLEKGKAELAERALKFLQPEDKIKIFDNFTPSGKIKPEEYGKIKDLYYKTCYKNRLDSAINRMDERGAELNNLIDRRRITISYRKFNRYKLELLESGVHGRKIGAPPKTDEHFKTDISKITGKDVNTIRVTKTLMKKSKRR